MSIQTHTSNYTTMLSGHNSSSAIGRYLLTNQICTCICSLTVLETSTNELQISILEVLLIKNTNRNYVSKKQSYTLLLFNNLLGPSEENIINHTNSTGLQKFFFFSTFFFTTHEFDFGYKSMLTSASTKLIVIDNSLKRSDRKKGSPFKDFNSFLWF